MCTSGGLFLDIRTSDGTDPDSGIVCTPFEDVVSSARLAYYLSRILALFA